VIDGSLHGYTQTGMAGVSNIGADRNWTGSHFDQANWYVFGRMAWDPEISAQGSVRMVGPVATLLPPPGH
jgi:alpha-glucuronidase